MTQLAEAIVLVMAGVAPWAFGSIDAWAEFGLYLGSAAIAILLAIADGRKSRAHRLLCLPSLGLAGLMLLALFQATPLPPGLLRWISPASSSLRSEVLPIAPERVRGDLGPVVSLPLPRLSQNPGESLMMAARLAGGWLLFQGVLGLPGCLAGLRRLAVVLACNATLLSLFSIIQALTWNGRILWIRPIRYGDAWSVGGPFDHHTHLAEYLNMGLGLALGLALPGGWRPLLKGKTNRAWAAYAAVMIAAGIVASNSRGGLLAMLAAAAAVGFFLRVNPIGFGLGAAAIVVLVAGVLFATGESSPLAGRLWSIVDFENNGYTVRLDLWRGVLRAWWDYPVWGMGLGSFAEGISPYLRSVHGPFFARAENEYLDLLSEGGLVGGGLLLLAGVGFIRLARRALAKAANLPDRGLILGAIFGVMAVAINSLSDFGPHVAGVGVPVLILIATLCRSGLDVKVSTLAERQLRRSNGRDVWLLYGLMTAGLGIAISVDKWTDVRVAAELEGAGLPKQGASAPSWGDFALTGSELERQRTALRKAVGLRQAWANGHLRLGMIDLILHARMTATELPPNEVNTADQIPDPRRIIGMIRNHDISRSEPLSIAPDRSDDPARASLVSAARSFLKARRACLVSSTAHAQLACLRELLDPGDPTATYLERALLLAGNQRTTLTLAGDVAAAVGENGLAARCWRRILESDQAGWSQVADAAANLLTPDQILNDVLPDGQTTFRFAERLYDDSASEPNRRKFLRAAARLLPHDRGLKPAERCQLEARIAAGLDERGPACERMKAALALQPENFAWRKDLIAWMVRWDQLEEAHQQAQIGLYYAPASQAALDSLEMTADALARRPTN